MLNLNKILLVLIVIIICVFNFGCAILKEYQTHEMLGKEFVLKKNCNLIETSNNVKKEPKYFLTYKNNVQRDFKIFEILPAGTKLRINEMYSYAKSFLAPNTLGFNRTEVLSEGKYKGLIVDSNGILETYWDKEQQKARERLNYEYVVEATPENIAKIEKEIEEEKQKEK